MLIFDYLINAVNEISGISDNREDIIEYIYELLVLDFSSTNFDPNTTKGLIAFLYDSVNNIEGVQIEE